jgi:DNA-binding response OmpR family regulator
MLHAYLCEPALLEKGPSMESTRILLIQRSGKSGRSFAPALERKGFEVEVVNTGKAALEHGPESWPDLVVLDAASLGTSGIRICQDLRKGLNGVPLIHIFPEGRGGSERTRGGAGSWADQVDARHARG